LTEAEWLACEDPAPMMDFLRGNASARKLRLVAVACCRHLGLRVAGQELMQAIEAAEGYADGLGSKAALKRARQGVAAVRHEIPADQAERVPEWVALWLAEVAASENAFGGVVPEILRLSGLGLLKEEDRPREGLLLRCLFGNPFRPTTIDPAWLTTEVLALARSIYDSRSFDRMPVLAEYLDEAGCDDDAILSHSRGPGPHARGCSVIELVLGKS
jgi:hypothetical protein